jgi:hypothetical protein
LLHEVECLKKDKLKIEKENIELQLESKDQMENSKRILERTNAEKKRVIKKFKIVR